MYFTLPCLSVKCIFFQPGEEEGMTEEVLQKVGLMCKITGVLSECSFFVLFCYKIVWHVLVHFKVKSTQNGSKMPLFIFSFNFSVARQGHPPYCRT